MKVLIADDEEKICQLIKNLVDWKKMEMDVIACVNDGITALKVIGKQKPDLVITDIRMPGHDGLELIKEARVLSPDTEFTIISGYRHFEYAQSAIQYGVKNYLLKPVKKTELNDELEKIRKNYFLRARREEETVKTTILMEQNRENVRAFFMEAVLFRNFLKSNLLSLQEVNEKYQFDFQSGAYQVVIVKIDGFNLTDRKEMEYIHDKLERLTGKILKEICFEMEYTWVDNFCYLLLNYANSNSKKVRHCLKSLLDELLLQKQVLNNMNVTIGQGETGDLIANVFISAKTAKRAIDQRLFEGANRLLEGRNQGRSQFPFAQMFKEFNKAFTRGVESLKENEIISAIEKLKQDMFRAENITGHEVLQMAKEVMNQFLFVIKKQSFGMQLEEGYFDLFCRNIENQSSFEETINYLKEQVLELFQKFKLACLNENRPIREAKRFIRENYQMNISLEMIGAEIGFNATYLCTLFKKEAGYTFSEYLTQVRIEKAKELLQETDHNISVICEDVGYSDLKNFTKKFKTYTGLRPNEYRRIYG